MMKNAIVWDKSMFAAAGGIVIYWLGGLDQLLTALLVLIVLDYFTGVLRAVHDRMLSSEIGFRGIAKKVLCLSVVALAFVIENITAGALPLREIVILFFVANEGLSILENAAGAGLPLPAKLRKVLRQLGEEDR